MNLALVAHFRIVDEGDDWLVLDKPAPLIVHPTNPHGEPTLLDGVRGLLAYEMANGARPAVVNRLDRETSGLIVIAKHPQAARELGISFERREVEKEYLAIITGWPERDEWTCNEPILRAGGLRPGPIWVLQQVHPQGKPCSTRFRVEQRFLRSEGAFALVRCFPKTGRMHQIRVHLAHAGHPIIGDKIYLRDGAEYLEWMETGSSPSLEQRLLLPRHALHAARLVLPWRGERMEWTSPLAEDLTAFLLGEELPVSPETYVWNRTC